MKLDSSFCLTFAVLLLAAGCQPNEATKTTPTRRPVVRPTRPTVSTAPPVARAENPRVEPLVVIETSEGNVTVRLDRRRAPHTVANFLRNCEHGYYNGTIFHQVVDGRIVLGGAFTAELEEKPAAQTVPNEAANGLKNRRGTIAMGRPLENPDGGTTQFFFNLSDNPQFDYASATPEGYGYCVFGEIVDGLEMLDRLSEREVHNRGEFELLPVRTVTIQGARQLR